MKRQSPYRTYKRRKRQSPLPHSLHLSRSLLSPLSSRDLSSRDLRRTHPSRDLSSRTIASVVSREAAIASRRVRTLRDPLLRATALALSRDLRVTASSRAIRADRDLLSRDRTIALAASRADTISRDRADLIRKTDNRTLPERSSSLSLSFAPRL